MAGETAQTAAESPYTVNSIGMLARMAAHGLGVAFVPAMAAEKHAAAGRLKRSLPAKMKCFIEFLRGRMGRDTAKAA
jgi:transcriptional regulator, lysR family